MTPKTLSVSHGGGGGARAEILRTTAVASIRPVHELALGVSSDPNVVAQFLVAVTDLNMLWSQFKLEAVP